MNRKRIWAAVCCIGLTVCLAGCKIPRQEGGASQERLEEQSAAPSGESAAPITREVIELEWETNYTGDLDGDGETERFLFAIPEVSSDGQGPEVLQLLIGNEREAVTSDLYEGMQNGPIYLVLQGGTARIVFSVDLMEGNAVTLLYKVEDYRPVLLDEISGQTAGWKDSDLRIQKYINVLGSWDAFRAYSFQNDTFQPEEELWEIRDTDDVLVVSNPLPVELEGENGTFESSTLAAGTEIKLRAFDGENTVHFQLRDGAKGVILLDGFENGKAVIDGKEDAYYFLELPYSG